MSAPLKTPNQFIQLFLSLLFILNSCGGGGAEKEKNQGPAEHQGKSGSGFQEPLLSAKAKSDRIVAVVNKAMPSVVSIHSEKIVGVQPRLYFNPFQDFFFDNRDRKRKSNTHQYKQQGFGSGVIISSRGLILTNHHVAGEADELRVTLPDEREFSAVLVGADKLSDLALIKIKAPPKNLPVAEMGDSDNLEVGETVLAIGNPFGYSNTVTMGIISAKGRVVGINSYENYLQTDAPINPGNSGGALVNLDGELVGINTAIASRTGASHGIGFAIPINMATRIMTDLEEAGMVTRGFLGVYLQQMDDNLATALGLKDAVGGLVSGVLEDSPAAKAGFLERDVITHVNGKIVRDINDLRNKVARLIPGKKAVFKVIRDGKTRTFKVRIGKLEEKKREKPDRKKSFSNFGLTLENIHRDHINGFGLEMSEGVVVTRVEMGSQGDKAGIRPGDVILGVGETAITSVNKFRKAVRSRRKRAVLVTIDRQGSRLFLGLELK